MTTTHNDEITLSAHPRGWRKRIGGACFYYGHDKLLAMLAARATLQHWEQLADVGHKSWPADELTKAQNQRKQILSGNMTTPLPVTPPAPTALTAPTPPTIVNSPIITSPATPTSPTIVPNGLTLHQIIDKYQDHIDARTQVSDGWKWAVGCLTLNLRRNLPNHPLASITPAVMEQLVQIYMARPKYRHKTGNAAGKHLSPDSCRRAIIKLKEIFLWADGEELFTAPRQSIMVKIFHVRLRHFKMTPTERQHLTQIETFDLETQLVPMYRLANAKLRCWILLGLNCGYASGEVAALACCDVKGMGTATPHIEKCRPKTGVYGRWNLWPETAALLKKFMKGKKPDDLIFTADNGSPLVRHTAKSRIDDLHQKWHRFTKWASAQAVKAKAPPIPHLAFKFLRKTGSQAVRNLSRHEIAESYLAHAENGVSAHYHRRDVDALQPVLLQLREHYATMLAAGADSTKKA